MLIASALHIDGTVTVRVAVRPVPGAVVTACNATAAAPHLAHACGELLDCATCKLVEMFWRHFCVWVRQVNVTFMIWPARSRFLSNRKKRGEPLVRLVNDQTKRERTDDWKRTIDSN